MTMHISEMVLDQWTSVASTCFPIGEKETYAIGFEATIGYKQAGIAIDGVILRDTCEDDGKRTRVELLYVRTERKL